MRRTARTFAALVVAAGLLTGAQGQGDQDRPKTATHHGNQIALDDDWDGAGACAVYTEDDIRCWDSYEQMERATGGGKQHPREVERGQRGTSADPVWAMGTLAADCNNDASRWLYLWEHNDFEGRVLKFNDVDYWQNLTSYGFNDATSSYWNTTRCHVYLAEHTNGGGSWHWATAGTAASAMPSGWNDRVSSLYIVRN